MILVLATSDVSSFATNDSFHQSSKRLIHKKNCVINSICDFYNKIL